MWFAKKRLSLQNWNEIKRIEQNNENSRDSQPKAIYFSKENKKFHFVFIKNGLSKNAKLSGIPENGILWNELQNKGKQFLTSSIFYVSSHSIRCSLKEARKKKILFLKILFKTNAYLLLWTFSVMSSNDGSWMLSIKLLPER